MISFATEDYLVAGFVGAVALFSVAQVISGLRTGKIISPSTMLPIKDRKTQPVGFWGSLTYYVVWILGTIWAIVACFVAGGRLPF